MRRLYHFLGSLPFALILIAMALLTAVAGTVLEAKTESHRFAALFTYGSPAFAAILAGFFLNILISALRRWPFKKRHVPFLTTHLGLLMVIGGTLCKLYFGLQGNMLLVEGSGSRRVLLPDSYALLIEERGAAGVSARQVPIRSFPGLEALLPHGKEFYSSWIKGGKAEILGLKPFAGKSRVRFKEELWDVVAEKMEEPERLAQKLQEKSVPTLLIAEVPEKGVALFACGKGRELQKEFYPLERLSRYISYDDGFLGYTLPFKLKITDRKAALELVRQYLAQNPPSNLEAVYEAAREYSAEEITLETPLRPLHIPEEPKTKLEENRPIALLNIDGEKVSLAYDPSGSGLKWPAKKGAWRLRFQPAYKEIPYRLRLRDARRLCYPGTEDPFSYEADILVKELSTGREVETTLSMNRVYETAEGYRFYLAGIAPGDESGAARVQLAVNYDPFRRLVTYPGAVLVATGAAMLFWLRRFFC